MFYLARQYRHGWGVERNYERAIYWYTQAAELGDGESAEILRDIYGSGPEEYRDEELAEYWAEQFDRLSR